MDGKVDYSISISRLRVKVLTKLQTQLKQKAKIYLDVISETDILFISYTIL